MKRILSFFIMSLGCMLIMCTFALSEALAHPKNNNLSNIYDKKISTYWTVSYTHLRAHET